MLFRLFKLRQIAFVGPDLLGSSVAMDKIVAKKLVEVAGVPVVPYADFSTMVFQTTRKSLT